MLKSKQIHPYYIEAHLEKQGKQRKYSQTLHTASRSPCYTVERRNMIGICRRKAFFMIDTVLFDLDGTLLPMDQEKFVHTYMGLLTKKMVPYGYEPQHLMSAVWSGTDAMVKNDGTQTNEEVFWTEFCRVFGPDARKDEPLFAEFYASEFAHTRTVCGFAPEAAQILELLKEKDITVVLATNPLFPDIATRQRIRWAGLEHGDFALVTTYENSHYCKPNPDYYREILRKLGKSPANCLMVGNDVQEDLIPARETGMEVFLLTDCLIDRQKTDLGGYSRGGFDELKEFLLKNL